MGVPSIVTLDEANSKLIVTKSFDLNQRGSYSAQLINRIFDSRNGMIHQEIIGFVVNVNPCVINDFHYPNVNNVDTRTYKVGEEGITFRFD